MGNLMSVRLNVILMRNGSVVILTSVTYVMILSRSDSTHPTMHSGNFHKSITLRTAIVIRVLREKFGGVLKNLISMVTIE